MIFVTVGNHFQPFDRLLRGIDEIAPSIDAQIIVQRGYSTYLPKRVRYFDFVPLDEAIHYIRRSKLVISHAGMGTLLLCKEHGTPIIVVPRRKKFGEHGTDHQMEIAKILEQRAEGYISIAYEVEQLGSKIKEVLAREDRPLMVKNGGRKKLIETIRSFIENL